MAPPGAGRSRIMAGDKLAYELAVAVLKLCLAPVPQPINRESLHEVNPVLSAYTKAQSTIPTYLGRGRNSDALGLHRAKAGAYPACRANASLALRKLERLGHTPAQVAALLGKTEAGLMTAVAALPELDAVAFPAPSSRPAAAPATEAGEPAEGQETATETQEEAAE
jgi:hypothetical protein